MEKNEVYQIEITGMTDEGDGVGRVDGIPVFVPYVIVGELAEVVIVKALKRYAYGRLLKVLRPSPHRVKAACPYFYQCGGCQLWHMDIAAELAYKRQKVQDCLTRIGGLDLVVEPVAAAGPAERYRNKAQFPVTPKGIGFYRRGSHQVIPMEDCLIQRPWIGRILGVVREWMEKWRIPAYDEAADRGLIRHIYTRDGESGILVTLVTRTPELPHREELVKGLLALGLPLTGILQNINPSRTNVVLGTQERLLWGRDSLTDRIGGLKFRISPQSFYQVNPQATERLYALALEMAELRGQETLWDVYCGAGTIGLFAANRVKRVLGIESVPAAVENARENARRNGIQNAEYYCGKAEEVAPALVRQGKRPDVVVLDPPRKGCDQALLAAVAAAGPRKIVYVSCKPSTLARDLKCLTERGYAPQRAVPVNMFPRSAHVETVCLLSKLKSKEHIYVDISLDELDLTKAEKKATYQEIKDYVLEHYGLKVSQLNIAQVKRECGIIERENYNKPKSKNTKQPQCPPEKKTAIMKALRNFGMI